MADEIINEQSGDNQEAAPLEVSLTEQKAREQGWVPQDEFEGEEHKWVEAGEFLRRGELFEAIESRNKEIKAIRATLNEFKNHHKNVQEAAYKKALADLKAKKKEALIEGDADLVIEVDEQLADVKAQQRAMESQPAEQEVQQLHPEFVAWTDKNTWYQNTPSMRAWADGRGQELAQTGKSPYEVLKAIEKEVKERFPEKFENPNRQRAAGVESGVQRGSKGQPAYQPNEIERRMAKKFVNEGLFKNEQEYYAELQGVKS